MPGPLTSRRALLASALATAGCMPLRRFPFDPGDPAGGGLQIRYFGVGCFLLSWGGTALLTDPFWSRLPLRQVLLGRIAPDPAQVDPHLPLLGDVSAVLVGHSHYDHMLDLPYVYGHLADGAAVFGSETLAHTLAPLDIPVTPLDDVLASRDQPGAWIEVSEAVRVLPLASGHPNNVAFLHFWQGHLSADRTAPPERAADYLEGITIAFLVDFRASDGEIIHRVYIQTTSRGPPDGLLPAGVLDERPVDVALLAMDCANQEARGRESIIDTLAAPTVIFCHWEDFFRPKDRSPRETMKINMPRLKAHYDADSRADYRFPAWDSVHVFPDGGGLPRH